ncbi:hypothetical protein MTO96_052237 [Rhipicephalus appendiculatus]
MLSLGLILMPLLLLSRKVRELFFMVFFWEVSTIWSETFDNSRRCALKPLQFIESHDPQLRKEGAIRMLEIGAGLGGNFAHISRTVKYTNVDPNAQFRSACLKELRRNPKGGSLIFLEHVAFPDGAWQRLLQNVVTPLWRITCCNCHLNRESVKQIEDAGFSNVTAHYIDADINVLLRRQVYGIATF